ncbi:PD-(D/E)XK nuclease family protein [Facklamia hominis]|nr:PD-(D/E)XK nuclease family protein [Facklamia hominis]WPJ91724.1 PD-(D/E)XK nuclease family protein [Facklamia hominis]
MIDNAANIQKERPYSYWVKASELFQNLPQASLKFAEDHVLIHGVIDAYWLRSNEGFVLIDYKTDRFHPSAHLSKEEQLARLKLKYQTQLSLYAQALKNALNMEAAGIYLVALDFNQVISMTE